MHTPLDRQLHASDTKGVQQEQKEPRRAHLPPLLSLRRGRLRKNAAPKEWVALQPFERFEPDQKSGEQHTRGHSPLIVGIRVRGRVARGASLRGAFAHFCGKANV